MSGAITMNRDDESNHQGEKVIKFAAKKKRSKWKTALFFLALLIVIPIICFALAAIFMEFAGGEKNINAVFLSFERLHFIGVTVQALLIALIIALWPKVVDFLVSWNWVNPHEYKKALDMRPKVALFLILYLVLIPIGPGRIWGLFISS